MTKQQTNDATRAWALLGFYGVPFKLGPGRWGITFSYNCCPIVTVLGPDAKCADSMMEMVRVCGIR